MAHSRPVHCILPVSANRTTSDSLIIIIISGEADLSTVPYHMTLSQPLGRTDLPECLPAKQTLLRPQLTGWLTVNGHLGYKAPSLSCLPTQPEIIFGRAT